MQVSKLKAVCYDSVKFSHMTLRGSLTSNDSSLSSLGCILSRPGDFPGFSAAHFISIMFSLILMDSSCLLMSLTLGCNTFGRVPVGSYMYTLLKYLDSSSTFLLSVDATPFPSNLSRSGILSLIWVRDKNV